MIADVLRQRLSECPPSCWAGFAGEGAFQTNYDDDWLGDSFRSQQGLRYQEKKLAQRCSATAPFALRSSFVLVEKSVQAV